MIIILKIKKYIYKIFIIHAKNVGKNFQIKNHFIFIITNIKINFFINFKHYQHNIIITTITNKLNIKFSR